MKQVLIIGGGYAGLWAAAQLSAAGRRGQIQTVLVDPRAAQEALPLLPDVVGGGIAPMTLRYPLATAAKRWGFEFRPGRVDALDPVNHSATLEDGTDIRADAIILTAGSSPRPAPWAGLHTLNGLDDAELLAEAIDATHGTILVVGGGYTGVEIATHAARRMRRTGREGKVVLASRSPLPCPGLPHAFPEYIAHNLAPAGVQLTGGNTLADYTDGPDMATATFTDGSRLATSIAVWATGVAPPAFIQDCGLATMPDGRVLVDEHLQAAGNVFIAGDCAAVDDGHGGHLRMSIQFAITQGVHAAGNALRVLTGRDMRPYRPIDLGYVVPMAHGRGCGTVLGIPLRGRLPILLHYTMGFYRAIGLTSRLRLLHLHR